jgi:hypothetical protein
MCPSNPRAEGKFTFTWRHTKPFAPPDGGHSWMISESGGYVHCVHCRTSVVLTHGLLTKPLPSGLCDLSPVMKVRRKFGQILSWV